MCTSTTLECCHYTAVNCERPPSSVTHGRVLFNDKKTYFYNEDYVEILCDLGYVIDDGSSRNNISRKIACQSDHTWDAVFVSCTGRLT